MRFTSYLFLAFTLLSFTAELNAQTSRNRIVTTDYNECLMGVKDTLGNWVVPPQYNYVNEGFVGTFLVWQHGRCGLLDSNGALLVPIVYDLVTTSPLAGYYTVESKDRSGVVNNKGDTVVPIIYRAVVSREDSTFFARKGKRKWVMYSPAGVKHKVPFRSVLAPRMITPHLYAVRKSRWFLKDKQGLMNDSARMMLRPKWDAVSDTKVDLIYLRKNKKCGYINHACATVWPVNFDCERESYVLYSYDFGFDHVITNIFNYDTIGVASIDNKYGLITASGRTILPFEYDSIDAYDGYGRFRYARHMYYVKKDGKYGIFSIKEGWIMQPEQEVLLPIRTLRTSSDSGLVTIFLNRKNGLYGVTSTSGQEFVPCRYKNYTKSGSSYLLYNNDTIVDVQSEPAYLKHLVVKSQEGIPDDSILPYYVRSYTGGEIPDDKLLRTYSSEGGGTLYFHPQGSVDTLFYNGKPFVAQPKNNLTSIPDPVLMNTELEVSYIPPGRKIDDTHVLYVDSTRGWRSKGIPLEFYIRNTVTGEVADIYYLHRDYQHAYYQTRTEYLFRDDGLVLAQEGVYREIRKMETGEREPYKFLVRGTGIHYAVMNNDGTFDIPEQNGAFGHFNKKYFWLTTKPHGSKYRGNHWKLIDKSTGKAVRWKHEEKNTQMWGNYTTVTTKKHGTQLYNIARGETVVNGYNEIEGMNAEGSLFMVRTCSGKTGVIDSTGKIIVDTIYLEATLLQKTGAYYFLNWNSYYSRFQQYYRFYCFYNDTGYVPFDLTTNSVVSQAVVTSHLQQTMRTFNDTLKIQMAKYRNYYSTGAYLRCYQSDSSQLRAWHWSNITDTLCWPRRVEEDLYGYNNYSYISQCGYCRKKTDVSFFTRPKNGVNAFTVNYVSDSVLSYYSYHGSVGTSWMTNVMLFENGPRNLTLDSLFRPGSDWKNFVINTVISYVNTHLYVEGDCHNPAAFPQMLNQRFLWSEEGIRLYPKDFKENYNELSITIPWADAMPYLRDDLKTKIPAAKK